MFISFSRIDNFNNITHTEIILMKIVLIFFFRSVSFLFILFVFYVFYSRTLRSNNRSKFYATAHPLMTMTVRETYAKC